MVFYGFPGFPKKCRNAFLHPPIKKKTLLAATRLKQLGGKLLPRRVNLPLRFFFGLRRVISWEFLPFLPFLTVFL